MSETIVVFCAHPDDEVIGAGGTIAKYTREKNKVIVIIFSYGEGSHPWLKKRVTVETRVSEAKEAGKILGCKETIFLGLKDASVGKHAEELEIEKKIISLIGKYRPTKIFTHSKDDPWPDHQSVYKIIKKVVEDIDFQGDVYSFDIWNPLRVRERNVPKLVIDISKTFRIKKKALGCFKSQKIALFSLLPSVYIKSVITGLNNRVKFGEVFYKIR